jgi:gluconate 2-dehydrogenase gamma chain
MRRRVFLLRGALFTGGLGFAALPAGLLSAAVRAAPEASDDLPESVWRTLAAVHAHLLPSEANAPGAAELDSLGYLRAALAVPGFDAEERAAIVQGAEAVERQAQVGAGKSFAELAGEEREAVLRAFESTEPGRRWLRGMLNYVIEALLADPVYGGNPEGLGWRWLGHEPGFPRPPAGKRWYLLRSPA